jgi:hypothetical protein
MDKIVGVTKTMYLLCKELERLEDRLVFSVLYSFAEILDSHHFCPGFDFENSYYEVQYDNNNCLHLMYFPFRGYMGDEGLVVEEKDILELIENLKKL